VVGLAFRPTGEDKSVPDIAGTMWIDLATSELRWLEYTYQYLEPERTSPKVGGRVDFAKMPDGKWIVSEWWIRMPLMAQQSDFQGRRRYYIDRYKQTGGLVVDVREGGGRRIEQPGRTGGIEGIVRDSFGGPARGVAVGIVGSDQQVYTDGEGRFGITGLPEGRYQLRVVPRELERQGFTPHPVARDVLAGEMSRVDYRLPSVREMLFETCEEFKRDERAAAVDDSSSAGTVVLAGTVVDSLGSPVHGSTVRVEWDRFDFSGVVRDRRPEDLRRTSEVRTATSDASGRYNFCEVPSGRTITLSASTAVGESDEIQFVIPEHELGAVRTLVLSGSTRRHEAPNALRDVY